jgi:hypothetical protein
MKAPRSRGSASFRGAGGLAVNSFVVRAKKTKHGPRTYFRENEYAQAAIQSLYPKGTPRNVNHSRLTRDVNTWLNKNSNFPQSGIGEISRSTVLRVLKQLARE